MDKLKSIASDIKAGWENMDKKKRVRLVSIVVTISVVLFLLVYATQRTEYKVLFSELEEADSGAIVEDLESKGMDYKLEDNGTTILIDKDLVDNYRIELAVNGPMPSTSTGFEIFDSSSMMATDEDRAIMYQRAISGELERAISSLANVESGKVLLNIPESSVFQNPDYQKEATASVVLQMNNNQIPDQTTVQGIAALVSGAVENLPQANVEILDTSGRLLSASISDGYNLSSDVVTEHQRIKNMVENDLEQKVRTLLAPVYGLENVQISVNTDLNFDAIERENIEYEQEEDVIRSQTESVTGSAALAQEVQGGNLEENTPAVIGEDVENDSSSYEHATNYEVNTYTTRIVEAPGAIERLTASVIIMDNPTDRAAMQGIIENALGVNNFREDGLANDSVQIEYVTPPTEDESPTIIGNPEFFETIITWITENWLLLVISIVVLTVILILFRVLRNRFADDEEDELEMEFAEILPPAPEPEETLFDKETEEKIRRNQVANEKEDLIREQTKENPELAAELIKIWLKEEDK